ncbi:ferrous iron transport protein B [Desulfotignum phosphitoxidans]|uniref:Ferrous iron transport protein B n=1 Tax=Desulfotignum phosphitoxidans DSM 13687 TaxID=1286635 RepID=S0FUH1_9BACT|nr:ferrous iron transport protein B [Desulfotignum phosphitoxidans]EMS78708.1 ferrous iron (Fe2+) transport protein FeoB [Desulfotignum phosphitoxidans DSM 13687]
MAITIALAGNPNSGKTTLFNALTGARQHVGNYPGVTVEKKQGICTAENQIFDIVDLPGTYSLSAYSMEEVVARDFIVNEKPAMIVNIVDGSNLERNLYLTLQFMEMGANVCIALNMMDVAGKRGVTIDVEKLSLLLGLPVVPMVARTGKGRAQLLKTVADHVGSRPAPLKISYGRDIDDTLDEMEERIRSDHFLTDQYPCRWVALKYLENDAQVLEAGKAHFSEIHEWLSAVALKLSRHLETTLDTHPEGMIADQRYGFITSILKQGVISHTLDPNRLAWSDKIDKIVTHRFLGPLIMIGVLMGLYQFTFAYSEVPVAWFENFFTWLGDRADILFADGLLKSLVVSGIIDGVGGVLGFVPLIVFMFLGISFLEDSGYLARMAFMLDRVFRMFGLHGASVMAFIVSGGIAGGCAVPGVMATRTLKSPKERLATLLTVPFMNCGAKLPVYALLVAAFFTDHRAQVMLIITLISWVGALLVAKLLRSTVIKGPATPFVMELPPYRLPTFKGLAIHTWERTWQYIRKAGTVILGISIVLWAMMTFPQLDTQPVSNENAAGMHTPVAETMDPGAAALRHSIAGRMGMAMEKVTRYAGFDWQTNIALLGGFAAKEVVVSTLGTAYSLGEVDPEDSTSLAQRLKTADGWGPITAFSLILFTIFYSPCFVAVVCIVKESGSWKWGVFSMAFNTLLALSLSIVFYQTATWMMS